MNTKTTKLKKIAAITMARNDNFFLTRWIKYYGNEIGYENLYIYLDGTDQEIPKNAGAAHITKLPHTDMSRTIGDKYRIGLMNDLSRELLKKYDIVYPAAGAPNNAVEITPERLAEILSAGWVAVTK